MGRDRLSVARSSAHDDSEICSVRAGKQHRPGSRGLFAKLVHDPPVMRGLSIELKKFPRAMRGLLIDLEEFPRATRGLLIDLEEFPRTTRGQFATLKESPRALGGLFAEVEEWKNFPSTWLRRVVQLFPARFYRAMNISIR